MSFAKRFNKGTQFEIDFDSLKYVQLGELFTEQEEKGIPFRFTAVWFSNSGKFGTQPVLVLEENGKQSRMVSLPAHLTETVQSIVNDYFTDVVTGKCGFMIYKYDSKYRKNCYSVRWVDLDPLSDDLPL